MQITIKNLNHSYRTSGPQGIEVLRDISLSSENSERISIVGPSGVGKSTLLRAIAGLLRPSSGAVLLDNQNPSKLWREGKMGFVFQDPVLLPWRNVAENVQLPLELLKFHGDWEQQIRRWLAAVNLTDFRSSYPDELSGGMRSRVAIARCVVTSPKLILMDEPFNGLDEIVAQMVMQEVANIISELHATQIFVSHNIQQAVFVADRVLVLSQRPASIVADISVPLGWPRATNVLSGPRFVEIVNQVRYELYKYSGANGDSMLPQ
jgi:NitT/TauT family transport system ATP-binding protein